ncbi:Maf family protein [Moraxella equi]|uniref:dTTP/UTP pyrophosphatase n=1 Tax=Moraxella equi TaxID=60442 RepID=A0A378QTB4_9GAMM|nr:Maf family protein [Moraxella equi]OPH36092.1 septum formation protein Maf [Moraxella equi]STZ04149.1 Maf-like protein yhdE [Moraxella equi]
MIPLILASTSPRRHELLTQLHIPFTVKSVQIDERFYPHESPHDYIMRMVKTKAEKACADVSSAIVITADTIGVAEDEILTKPADKAHAFAMWDKLSDNTHEIWTAVCASIVKDGQVIFQKVIKVATDVVFIKLTDRQKDGYWATGEPADKAGAYAIQGGAMAWVRSINGSYTNVVGLPLAETAELIDDCL